MVEPLPRLYVNWQSQSQLFERYWDIAMHHIEALETQLTALQGQNSTLTSRVQALEDYNVAHP